MHKLISASIFLVLIIANIPLVAALPASRGGEYIPTNENCVPSMRRFSYGSGRRSSSTAVLVTLRQQVGDAYGTLDSAASAPTVAEVPSTDEISVILSIRNTSIFDIGNVEIRHHFSTNQTGFNMTGVASLNGAEYERKKSMFIIDRVPSGETAKVTFRMLFNEKVDGEVTQSIFELNDFDVMESERRFPPSSPDTVNDGISVQDVVKLGIGGTAAVCFTAFEPSVATGISRTSSASIDPSELGRAVSIEKRVSTGEVRPGSNVVYTISVTNRSSQTLRNILVDDRFDNTKQKVKDAGGGLPTGFGIRWVISELDASERWMARYSTEINDDVAAGASLPNTVTLTSEDLVDVPTSQLRSSSHVRVVGKSMIIPQTGIDMLSFFFVALQVLAGVMIAFGLFGVGLWVVVGQKRGQTPFLLDC